jgi:hypothetical protein
LAAFARIIASAKLDFSVVVRSAFVLGDQHVSGFVSVWSQPEMAKAMALRVVRAMILLMNISGRKRY